MPWRYDDKMGPSKFDYLYLQNSSLWFFSSTNGDGEASRLISQTS